MMEFFQNLFTQDFMPQGQCLLWRPETLWLLSGGYRICDSVEKPL